MVVGYNHNVMYQGEVFHVQTEDSGVANPHIVTLLYREGTIIASTKISYADILKVDNLERVVEELMKEQHKAMLRRLKSGEFDGRIAQRVGALATASQGPQAGPEAGVEPPVPPPRPEPGMPAASGAPDAPPPGKGGGKPVSLDEVILDFLMSDDT